MAKCQCSSICSLSTSTPPHVPADPQLTCSSTLLSRLLGHRMFLLEPRTEISIPLKSAIPNTALAGWLHSSEYMISFLARARPVLEETSNKSLLPGLRTEIKGGREIRWALSQTPLFYLAAFWQMQFLQHLHLYSESWVKNFKSQCIMLCSQFSAFN